MRLSHDSPGRPGGIVVDRGTGKRIPFVRWFDAETGEYEAFQPTADGLHYWCEEDCVTPIVVRGRAVGRLELVPIEQAHAFGVVEPEKKQSAVQPGTIDRVAGLEVYKKVYSEVWRWRGESRRVVADRWDEFLTKNDFLDCFILKRRQG